MRRLVVAALAALVLVGTAGCAGGFGVQHGPDRTDVPAAADGTPVLGVVANTLGYGSDVGRAQSTVRTAGIRLLREELSWFTVEPSRGTWRWAATDRLMVAAAHRRLRLLVLLNGVPRWAARPNGGLPTLTAAFGAYVRRVVARYGPDGTFWRRHPNLSRSSAPVWFELWNEPWFAPPMRSTLTADRYAALASAGLDAGRAADPHARFLLAGDTSFDGDASISAQWLARIERAAPGLLARADGITAHPYAASAAVSLSELAHVRDALTGLHVDVPIWVTEVGWSTCRSATAACVTEQGQAGRLDAFLRGALVRPRSDVAKIFVYDMHDLGAVPANREQHFGLLRLNGSRKPSWAVMRAWAGR